jgi:hypothetical protein
MPGVFLRIPGLSFSHFFQDWGMAIPEGTFYLQGIHFIQQLSLL